MPPRKKPGKRVLENPGDLSVSLAPAAPKKVKTPKGVTTGKASTETTASSSQATEPVQGSSSTAPTTKAPTTVVTVTSESEAPKLTDKLPIPKGKNKKAATEVGEAFAPQPNKNIVLAEVPPPTTKIKKSGQSKKPSKVADNVQKQVTAKQNAKEVKEAKKAKKVEATVITETPEETAMFLAQAKGQAQPAKTSPAVVSPNRKKLVVDRAKAMEQLVNSHAPSSNPSVISGASAATGTSDFAGSIAPDDSVSQVSKSKPKNTIIPDLQFFSSGPSSRGVSPAAPPLLSIPLSSAVSRDVSPSAESAVTLDNFDEELTPGVDFKTLLKGIPAPWNVGPTLPPPPLPNPLHLAKLKPDVLQLQALLKDKSRMQQASKEEKDRAKIATRPRVNNFREQDQVHLKLNLEFMDNLVATVYAFPDEETCWNFALMSNYLASMKLGRSYRLEQNSEHCRVLYSRISQSRGRFVSPALSDGIRDNYTGLSWKSATGMDDVQALAAVRQRVTEMIKDSSFLAPDDRPTAYYQNAWFMRELKMLYWSQPSSKGFSDDHSSYFSGISYPLLALVVTATEKMLAVVAAGPVAATNRKKEPESKFSHSVYGPRFDSHLMTLAGSNPTSIIQNPTVKLAIPLSALSNYGAEPEPKAQVAIQLSASSSKTIAPGIRSNSTMETILHDPALSADQKLQILSVIYSTTEAESHSHSRSARSARQYQGLWTEVTAGSDDSEVEAQRAGALPKAGDQANAVDLILAIDSDQEMDEGDGEDDDKGDGQESSDVVLKGTNKADGASGANSETEGDSQRETESRGKDRSVVMVDAEVKEEGSGNEDSNPDPGQLHAPQFFTVDGGLAGVCSSDDDDGSDGKGASGNRMVLTVASSDDDDDE